MAVELATDFSQGSIYFVDPLTPFVTCPNCSHNFVARYSAKVEKFTCDNCGGECDPDFVQRGKRPVLILQNPAFKENYRGKISEENLQEIQAKLKGHLLLGVLNEATLLALL